MIEEAEEKIIVLLAEKGGISAEVEQIRFSGLGHLNKQRKTLDEKECAIAEREAELRDLAKQARHATSLTRHATSLTHGPVGRREAERIPCACDAGAQGWRAAPLLPA